MKEVFIVHADVWNGDYTRSYIFGVYDNINKVERAISKHKLPAFSKFRTEKWLLQ